MLKASLERPINIEFIRHNYYYTIHKIAVTQQRRPLVKPRSETSYKNLKITHKI